MSDPSITSSQSSATQAQSSTDPSPPATESLSEDAAPPGAPSAPVRPSPKPPRTRARIIREWGLVIIIAIAVSVLMRIFVLEAYRIPSASMVPTLEVGSRLIVLKIGYGPDDIDPGHIVVFENPDPITSNSGINVLIKRVVATGGDTVQIRNGRLYVNDILQTENYLPQQGMTFSTRPIRGCDNAPETHLCQVPEGSVFVLGDNRTLSQDSRYYGPIPADSVKGRAVFFYWPLDRIGRV